MKSLYETIEKKMGSGASSICKHLQAVEIKDWADLSKTTLYELRDELLETCAASSAKTTLANFASILTRYEDEIEALPADWRDILKITKTVKPVKTYLTEAELAALEKVKTHTRKEAYILNVFLISAWTGARVSDAIRMTTENITEDGYISYIAVKTGKQSIIPMKKGLDARIRYISENPMEVSLVAYNKAVRRLAQKAGIDSQVVVVKGGKEKRGPKWQFVSSHTARISTATCLAKRGVAVSDLKQILAHSNIQMTERYIVPTQAQLSAKAMKFFE